MKNIIPNIIASFITMMLIDLIIHLMNPWTSKVELFASLFLGTVILTITSLIVSDD